ncbi:MAG: hypothetical protein COB46_12105 [Rhodospirillaceae bacterium]|nr:MAG: hypothetical protein COB46_12105 [Rhodospirillaceae bacterium]
MMKLANLSLATAAITLLSFNVQAAIPGTSARPAVYEVTVKKVELCQDSACNVAFTIGESDKAFDISSATAGADVGNYIDISNIPLYQTWSHVRVTISSTFSVGAIWTDGDGDACGTSNPTQASGHAAVYAGSVGGTATAADFVIPNVGFSGIAQSDYDTFNLTKANGAATATIIYPLTASYTCKGIMPRVEVQFDTSAGFGYVAGTAAGVGTACQAFPMPPTITITVTDP